jgi:hypothetical protein
VKIDGGSSVQQILIQLNHDPDCRIPPPIVRIFNTQFSSSPEHQQSNLQSTVNFINSFERNSQDVQVLMVDFNSPGANELEALKQLFFVDAWETYSASNEMKSAGLTYPSTAPTERRDRIFVRHTGGKGRGNAAEAKMHLQKVDVKGTRGHTPASDHLGVYAQVTLDYGARAAAADILPPVTEGDPNTVPAPRKDGGFIAKVELTMTNLGHASLSESNMLRNSMATALARKLRVPRSDVFVNLPVMDGSAGTLNLEGGVNDATVVMVANISSEVNTGDFASMMQDIKEKPLPLPGRLGKAQYLDSSARACQVQTHTHTHTHTVSHIHIYAHTRIHARAHFTRIHEHANAHTIKRTHTQMNAHTHTHTHAHTYTHTHTHTHARTHLPTHTQTHTHTSIHTRRWSGAWTPSGAPW